MTSTLQERPPDNLVEEPEQNREVTTATLGNLRNMIIVVIALAGAVFAFGALGIGGTSGAATEQDASALSVLSSDLVSSAKEGGAADAIGGYLPGTGIILTVQLPELRDAAMQGWVQGHLDPFAERLALLPDGEAIVVTVNGEDQTQARIWSLEPEAIAGNEGNWNQLVSPATFRDAGQSAVVVAEPTQPQQVEESATETSQTATPAPATTAPEAAPQTPAATSSDDDGAVRLEGAFSDRSNWSPIFGSWVLNNGIYSQSDSTGFGYASQYTPATPGQFDVTVEMRAQTGDMNGGIIYGLPDVGTKAGGKIIDLTDSGGYLRWGEYDEAGEWSFIGGAPINPPLDNQAWNKLTLRVRSDGTGIVLNDTPIATIDAVDPQLGVALVTSVASIDFRNFSLTDRGAGEVRQPDPVETGDSSFDDDLADWSLLSGSWSASDGVLVQANADAYDQMTHFARAPQDDYRVQVELRAAEGSTFSGGLLFNASTFGQRPDSQVFDIVDDGSIVRWAGYDQNGVFAYRGGLPVAADFDADAWHTLAVEVRDGRAEFSVDGSLVGASTEVGTSGYVGLVTSLASMEFRNFAVTSLQ